MTGDTCCLTASKCKTCAKDKDDCLTCNGTDEVKSGKCVAKGSGGSGSGSGSSSTSNSTNSTSS